MRARFSSSDAVHAPSVFRFIHYHWQDANVRPTLRRVLECWITDDDPPSIDWDEIMEGGNFLVDGDSVVVDIS